MELVVFTAIIFAPAILLTLTLSRFARNWSRWRVMTLSAVPAPGAVLALCAFLFVDAANSPPDKCGTDACGMAMAGAVFVGTAALPGMIVGGVLSWIIQVLIRR